jgi:hypothetical protein
MDDKRVGMNIIPAVVGEEKPSGTLLQSITMEDVEALKEKDVDTRIVYKICGRYGSEDKKTMYGYMDDEVYEELHKSFPRKVGAAVSVILRTKLN